VIDARRQVPRTAIRSRDFVIEILQLALAKKMKKTNSDAGSEKYLRGTQMPKFVFRILLICMLLSGSILAALQRGPSTQEARDRAIKIARQVEQEPLNRALYTDREWLLKWLMEVPDVQVKVCADVLGGFLKKKYKYSSEIVVQQMLSSGAFALENFGKESDDLAMYSAGLDGVLNAYASILKADPKAKSAILDELAAKTAEQRLAFVREASKGCK
jgi:hypothetical protein